MNRTLTMTLLAVSALTAAAISQSAMAETITAQGSGTAPFADYSVGTTATTGFLNSTTITSPGFDNISSITFAQGTGSGTGVYAGTVSGISDSPFTLGTFSSTSCSPSCPEYFSVQTGGTITITFNSAQTSLDILWGTVDVASGYNLVTTSAGQTIDGATIDSLMSSPASGAVDAAVEITGLNPFLSVTFQDTTGNNPAFEFDIGQTPIPGALPLFATGLSAFGLFGWRRKRKNASPLVAA